jgi:hypothetical protein
MGESEWRLTATGITLLALMVTGFQLVRCIWRGYPVRVRRYPLDSRRGARGRSGARLAGPLRRRDSRGGSLRAS